MVGCHGVVVGPPLTRPAGKAGKAGKEKWGATPIFGAVWPVRLALPSSPFLLVEATALRPEPRLRGDGRRRAH